MSRPDIPDGFDAPPPMTQDERDECNDLREKYGRRRVQRMEEIGLPLKEYANPGRPR